MADTKAKPKMVKIKLRKDREHQDDFTVGLNGEMFRIKRGVEVEVPEGVKEILDNSERMDDLATERSMALAAGTELTQ